MASSRVMALALVILLLGGLLVLFQTDSGSAILASKLTTDTVQPLNTATVVQSKTTGCAPLGGTTDSCAFTSGLTAGNLIIVTAGAKSSGTLVQNALGCAIINPATSVNCAFGSSVTKNDLLVVAVSVRTALIHTPTDTLSTAYSRLGSCGNNTVSSCIFYGTAGSAGANTITVLFSAPTGGRITIFELSGVTATGSASATGTGSCTANVQFTASVGSVAFAGNSFLVATYATNTGGMSYTQTNGFTNNDQANGGFNEWAVGGTVGALTSPTTFPVLATSTANCAWAGEGGYFPTVSSTLNVPTDTQANTYSLLGSCATRTSQSCIFYVLAQAGTDTVTVTATAATQFSLQLYEVSGVTSIGATSNVGTGACGTNPFTYSTASQTFTNSPFLIGFVQTDGNAGAPTSGTGFTGAPSEYATSGVSSPTTFPMTTSSSPSCLNYAEEGAVFPQSVNTAYASTGLSVALVANTNYVFTAYITATTSASSSLNFEIHAFAGGATLVIASGYCTAGTTSASGSTTSTGTPILSTNPTGTPEVCTISGRVTVASTGDTLQIDWSNPAGIGATTIKAGSFLQAQPGA